MPPPLPRAYPGAMPHRPYRDEDDLHRLLGWLSDQGQPDWTHPDQAHTGGPFMHPGELVWWLRQNTSVDPERALELFFGEAGGLQRFVFSDPPTWAVLQGAPGLPAAVWDDLVAYAVLRAGAPVTVRPHEDDAPQLAALTRAGFAPRGERMVRLVRVPGEADRQAVDLPGGFHFSDMATGEVSSEARVELHQSVWHPSRVTLEAYHRLRASPLYRPELDVVVVGPGGELAAYALGWFDPGSGAGLMEPVGTRASFRQRGLGQRLIREVTRRLAGLGACRITIGTGESNHAARALYASAGYRPGGFWVDWQPG